MSRDYKVYLQDILVAIKKIEKYTRGLELKEFKKRGELIDAVVRNLEIIGEATKNVPEKIRTKHGEIEWRKISGLRDILIHQYFGVDLEILWDIVRNKLTPLKRSIKDIIS